MANYINGTELQKDVYATLSANVPLSNLIEGVYDEVSSSPTFPYVTISEVVEVADNSLHSYGRSSLLNIHVWSKYRGNKETLEIIQEIISALDKTKFSTSTSYSHISTHYLDYRVLKEPEDNIRHGIARFRIYTIEK